MMTDEILKRMKQEITEKLDVTVEYTDDEILGIIEGHVFDRSKSVYMSISEKKEIIEAIFNSKRRFDVLQPLLNDRSITEIMINGPEIIFTERNGRIEQEKLIFESEEKLYNIIQSMVAKINRTVNEASPIVDARLKDGSRINAVLPPVALNGPILTIRKFPDKPLTICDLINMGSLNDEAACFLEKLVKAKFNIFICGGTGSGKTTFLNALSNFIPGHERIITIEDSAELQIKGIDNTVRLETRNANTEGKGEITIKDLIKASLRMRPDRIIVGEVRGAEALDMLQAMNTGHDGSLSTGHANSAFDMLSRLETMVLCGAAMPIEAIRHQIASAIDVIVHLGRMRDRTRKVIEITEVVDYKKGIFHMNNLYLFDEEEDSATDVVKGCIRRTENALFNTRKLKMAGVKI